MFRLPMLLAAVATLALAAAPLAAQDGGASRLVTETPLLSLDEFTTATYVPRHTNPHELLGLAQRLHGRYVHVVERGGYNAPAVENLQLLGNAVLVFDEPAYAQRVVTWLASIDVAHEGQGRQRSAMPETQVVSWSPDHMSLVSAQQALEPFRRQIDVPAAMTGRATSNVTALPEQQMLVLRDTPDHIAAMVQLLESLDVPETQLLITVMVVEAGGDGEQALPADLSGHLSKLVPYDAFSRRAMGLVRSGVRARSIEIEMPSGDRLELRPEAWDGDARTLSTSIAFRAMEDFGFTVRTSVATGEYVVLGAGGADPELAGMNPLLVVMKIEAL